ncbi:acyl carrier protein [Solibacillus sp. MA9]|uniref:Acyl carrier protein n=1 Tax=Solibacillus palustris TaxID=2908203 RepID=A0ABS9UAL8_9BACL|nr:acyl carrier protein [Solibacillus sp. MA9]MCH7321038.1 acyl carrier protein [Solibacillus sp. MA9]
MNLKEFIALCEEILEIKEGKLTMDTRLDNIEEWDSLTRMDLVSYCDEKFNTTLPIEIFRDTETFQDVVNIVKPYLQVAAYEK